MKTTWTLELKGDRAQRVARSLRRDLQSLQSALEGVDLAARRTNSALGAMSSPAAVQRRVRGEREVERAAQRTHEVRRSGSKRVAQDERVQARIRVSVDRAQRANARAAEREAQRASRRQDQDRRRAERDAARADRTWRREMRERGRLALFNHRLDQRATREAERQHQRSIRELGRPNETLSMLGGVGGVMGRIASVAAQITATAAAMVTGFAAVGFEIGRWIVQMATFRESAVTTLGAVLGGRGTGAGSVGRVGAAAFRRSQAIARLTPADERSAIEADVQIASAGFRGRQAERVSAASLDAQALNSLDPTAQRRFVLGLSQLHGSARAREEDIRQTAFAAGIGPQAVTRRAAQLAGVTQNTGETDIAYQRRIDQARLGGRITGRIAEEAVLQELQSVTGQRLGGFARLRGRSLGGAVSNLESAPLGMLTSFGVDQLPGMIALRDTIAALGNALSGASPAGMRLQRSIAGIIDTAGQAIGSFLTPERIEQFVGMIADALPQIAEVIRLVSGPALEGLQRGLGPLMTMFSSGANDRETTLAFFQQLAESLGYIVGVSVRITVALAALFATLAILGDGAIQMFDAIISAPMRLIEVLTTARAQVGELAAGIGTAIADGIRTGITGAVGSVRETVGSFAGSIVSTARGVLDINSPSRVFAQIGAYTAEGFAIGLERGRPDVGAAVSGMLSAPGAVGGAGARGPVTINVVVEGRSGEDDEGLADRIARRVADLFAGDLDRAALTVG